MGATGSGMKNQVGLVASAAIMLAGCGGSQVAVFSAPAPAPVAVPTTPDEAAIAARAARTALFASYTPVVFTNIDVVPLTGNANYQGYMTANLGNINDTVTNTLSGQMTLNIEFEQFGFSLSGIAHQFFDGNDIGLNGTLVLSDGRFDRAGNPNENATINITTSGTLTDVQGRELMIGAQLEGDFLGSSYEGIGGDLLGRVTIDGATQNLDGIFIAAQQ